MEWTNPLEPENLLHPSGQQAFELAIQLHHPSGEDDWLPDKLQRYQVWGGQTTHELHGPINQHALDLEPSFLLLGLVEFRLPQALRGKISKSPPKLPPKEHKKTHVHNKISPKVTKKRTKKLEIAHFTTHFPEKLKTLTTFLGFFNLFPIFPRLRCFSSVCPKPKELPRLGLPRRTGVSPSSSMAHFGTATEPVHRRGPLGEKNGRNRGGWVVWSSSLMFFLGL